MLVQCVFVKSLKLPSCFGRPNTLGECCVPNVNHIHPSTLEDFNHKTHLNPSPMITLDHLGESYVLTFYISYIKDNAYSKFGVLRGFHFVFKFSNFNYPIFSVFFLLLVCFS